MANSEASHVAAADEAMVAFEWRLDEDTEAEEAKKRAEAAQRHGGEAHVRPRPTGVIPGLELIPIVIFGVVIATGLITQVIDWWADRRKPGLLIHVGKDGKLEIRPIANIPPGQVLFVGVDGTTFQYANVSQNQLHNMMDAAIKGITPAGGNPVSGQQGSGQ
jgi:hypothetical protein